MLNPLIKKLKRKVTNLFSLILGNGEGESFNLKKTLVRGSLGSLGLRITDIFLGLITSVIFARLLGPEGLGVYSYVLAIITILVVPTQFGLPKLLTREIAAYEAKQEWSFLKGILVRSNQFVALLALLLICLIGLLLYLEAVPLSDQEISTFWVALPLLFIRPLVGLRVSALRGLQEIILGLMPERLIKPVLLILLVGIAFGVFGGDWFTPVNVMLMVVVSFLVAFVIGAWWLKEKLPDEVKSTDPDYVTGSWFKEAMPFLLIGGLAIINNQTDLVLLGYFRPSDEVGIYKVATKGAGFVAFSLGAVNMAVSPVISKLWSNNDLEKLQKVVTKSTLAITAFSLPVALIFIFGGSYILDILFGIDYVTGHVAMAILCVGYLFRAITGSVGQLLSMTKYANYASVIVGISAVSNIILNLLLIPSYGIEGAALASMISFVVMNSLHAAMVYNKLKIYPSFIALLIK